MSLRVIVRMALAILRQTVSPIPIGRPPGHLSSAINLQARRGPVAIGSKRVMQRRFATFARLATQES